MDAQLLDELIDAFESKGYSVRGKLLPGISKSEIDSIYPCVSLCEEIYQLYSWGNGSKGGLDLESIVFRDTGFLPLEQAKKYASNVIPYYVHIDGPEQIDNIFAFPDFDKWVAISGYEGMVYAVVCGDHTFGKDYEYPVLCIGSGSCDIIYDSVEAMFKTCIDWVKHESWGEATSLSQYDEMSIWKRHNPITFP